MPRRGGGFGGGRSSGGGGGLFGRRPTAPAKSSSSRAPPPSRRQQSTAPATRPSAPAPAMGGGTGLGGMIMQGMAFGAGSAVAHRVIGGVANSLGGGGEAAGGAGAAPAQEAAPAVPEYTGPDCSTQQNGFFGCLEKSGNDIGFCQTAFDDLQMCLGNKTDSF
mmetsp:Transcript_45639/g.109328  ORF Transcript_45639/g.109328 Transcript_45639/m.109328 type:complete len:163 (+) Transcript_45639:33-521(+)